MLSVNDEWLKRASGHGHKKFAEWKKIFGDNKKVHLVPTFQTGHGAQYYFGHYHVDPTDPKSNDGWFLQPHPIGWPDPRESR